MDKIARTDGAATHQRRAVNIALDIGLGQLLSLLMATTAICSGFLVDQGFNLPTTQATLNYLLLLFFCGGAVLWRGKPLSMHWRIYPLLALADVEANFLIVYAYQFTSITSVTLLDCATIPFVMALSTRFLGVRHTRFHICGALIATMGLATLVFCDAADPNTSATGSRSLVGDLLVLAASALYALSNVTEEGLVKQGDLLEVLAMLGLYGSLVSGVQMFALERDRLHHVRFDLATMLPLAGFVAALFVFYCVAPVLMLRRGAAALNLSLLSSDAWVALARAFLFGGFDTTVSLWGFVGSLSMVAGGLMLYHYKDLRQEVVATVEEELAETEHDTETAPSSRMPLIEHDENAT